MTRHSCATRWSSSSACSGSTSARWSAEAALLTEVVFGLPGVGRLTYNALIGLDLPVIMATVIYGAFFIVLANAIVDIGYVYLDPRLRPH